MIDLVEEFKKYGIPAKGVIHVGAHLGEELRMYEQMGFKRVLWVEANPVIFNSLTNQRSKTCILNFENIAVSDKEGVFPFFVTNNEQSSSLLKLGRHKQLHPWVVETQTIEVECTTLNKLFGKYDISDYNLINIDIQGAELMAMKGATEILKHIDAINSEVNLTHVYEDCGLKEELDAFLSKYDLTEVSDCFKHCPEWGDVLYVKKSLVPEDFTHTRYT